MDMNEIKRRLEALEAKVEGKMQEVAELPYKPVYGEPYWTLDAEQEAIGVTWNNDSVDNRQYRFGVVFRTKAEAKAREVTMDVHYRLRELGSKYHSTECCSVLYLDDLGGWRAIGAAYAGYGAIYFKSTEEAIEAAETIEDEFSEEALITYLSSN